jgi:acetyl-CoA carboxylase biotin carboxylase subunit
MRDTRNFRGRRARGKVQAVFEKILIADRGEIAVRIIRACREMKIATVAVYSEADRDSLHVQLADESVCIGPPPLKESYLNDANILMAATLTGAEAIHPGYGGLAEKSSFAESCEACNIRFIGPSPEAMAKMGNKATARRLMQKHRIPVLEGIEVVENEQDALAFAHRVNYPVMIKAAAGGGGRGLRVAFSDEELLRGLKLAQREAEAAFNNGTLLIEKFLSAPRHIEVQILADHFGNIIHLGERECSIQTSRYQKMLEECPSPAINPHLRGLLGQTAKNVAQAVGYTNAGTVEFLLDRDHKFYFLEMNTRIQVEHPVTEAVTRLDLIKEQIRIAAGERLHYKQRDVRFFGHAIECRITAEDPDNHFHPCTGRVTRCFLPAGNGLRVDSHLYPGYEVPAFYDSLLAKVIAWGNNREEAIARMERALAELQVEGVRTNKAFHQRILANAFFRKGETHTNFIQRRLGADV